MPDAALYFLVVNEENKDAASQEIKKLLIKLNSFWVENIKDLMAEALSNIEKNLNLNKVKEKNSVITKENPIVKRYFIELGDK